MSNSVTHGDVPVPNEMHKGNRLNGSSPLGHTAPATSAPNNMMHGGHANGSFSQARSASPVQRSDLSHRFDIQNARRGQDEPVAEPGKPLISNSPFNPNGSPLVPVRVRDNAQRGK